MSGKYVIYFPRAIIYFPRALFLSLKYIEVVTYLCYVSSIYLLRKRFIQAGFDTSIVWLWARRSTDWATVAWMEIRIKLQYKYAQSGRVSEAKPRGRTRVVLFSASPTRLGFTDCRGCLKLKLGPKQRETTLSTTILGQKLKKIMIFFYFWTTIEYDRKQICW